MKSPQNPIVSGQNESFLHAVIQAQQAQQPQRADEAWFATGILLFAAIVILGLLSRWIFRGGLARAFPSVRRF